MCIRLSVLVLVFVLPFSATAAGYNPSQDDNAFFPVKESKWSQHKQSLYQGLLSAGSFDLMIVPFQVRDHAIDAAGRALMTRYLMAQLEASGKFRIPDPLLVENALGESSERFEQSRVNKRGQSKNTPATKCF